MHELRGTPLSCLVDLMPSGDLTGLPGCPGTHGGVLRGRGAADAGAELRIPRTLAVGDRPPAAPPVGNLIGAVGGEPGGRNAFQPAADEEALPTLVAVVALVDWGGRRVVEDCVCAAGAAYLLLPVADT